MRLGIRTAVPLAGLFLAASIPSSAQLTFNGVCTMNATITFNGSVTTNSPPRNWIMNATGTCVTDAEPLSPIKHMSVSGSGPGQVTQCGVIRLLGSYAATWTPFPAPPASNGTAEFIGSSAGGVLHLSSPNPMFRGFGVLGSGGALDCVNGGTTVISFVGTFSFVDP